MQGSDGIGLVLKEYPDLRKTWWINDIAAILSRFLTNNLPPNKTVHEIVISEHI